MHYRLRSERDLLSRAESRGIRRSNLAIAEAAGVSHTTVNAMRNGRPVLPNTLLALSRLFECSPEDLFEVIEDEPAPTLLLA